LTSLVQVRPLLRFLFCFNKQVLPWVVGGGGFHDLILKAFITGNSSLKPLPKGLLAQIQIALS